MSDVGLLLMDLSLKPIGFDRGAAAMLNFVRRPGIKPDPLSLVPKEILNILRNRKLADLPTESSSFHIGPNEYNFRAYLLDAGNGSSTQSIVALHLEKVSSASDAVYEIAARYHLTDREREVLSGISLGLPKKDVGERLGISPNTVKEFQ